MKIQGTTLAALCAAAVAAGTMRPARAGTVFSDNLTNSASTVNAISIPSGGNTTSYDIASGKNSSADVIASGVGLGLTEPISTSAIGEAQAIFTTTPIVLTNVGDNIDLTVTFTDKAGSPTGAYFGLYNSGGTAPKTSLANGGLSSALTTDATGGAQNYFGYITNLQNITTAASKIETRPVQNGASNTSQDLISAGASGSQSYTGATNLGSSPAVTAAIITTGNTYTEDFLITVTAAAAGATPIQYSLLSNLYSGTSATGTPLLTTHVSDPSTGITPAAFGYNGFDALAFGLSEKNSTAIELDYSSVTVSSNTVQSLLLGDANGDGKVDVTDLNIVLNHLGTTDSNRSDGNFDGAPTIDLNDLNDVLNNLDTTSAANAAGILAGIHAVPEPASLASLAIGSLAFIRRSRKRS